MAVSVVIAALNEAESIGEVVRSMPWAEICECIVVDNGSTDGTGEIAASCGARVVTSPRGYGRAMFAGMQAAVGDVLFLMDGDGSDDVSRLGAMVSPIAAGDADFVIGSRLRGTREAGSMLPSQVFAGWLIGRMVKLVYGFRYTDMGPMRAIRRSALVSMDMQEMTYGWSLEMQIKAVLTGLRIAEVPVNYRRRIGGVSKVAGNFKASIVAAWRIFGVFVRVRRQGVSRA